MCLHFQLFNGTWGTTVASALRSLDHPPWIRAVRDLLAKRELSEQRICDPPIPNSKFFINTRRHIMKPTLRSNESPHDLPAVLTQIH
ncbi:MAG: hypothetical protein ABL858_06590 [Candidatus Nitrotoga sp.]